MSADFTIEGFWAELEQEISGIENPVKRMEIRLELIKARALRELADDVHRIKIHIQAWREDRL